jgi:hypothetical protein
MKHTLQALIFLLVLLHGSAVHSAETKEHEAAAAKFAAGWLPLIDAGKYDQAWKQTSPSLQSTIKKDRWQSEVSHSRRLLGKIRVRRLLGAVYTTKLPNDEQGQFVVVTFFGSFERLGSGLETVIPQLLSDGTWVISGYHVKPADATE